jgi:hypothetical protein
MNVIQVLVEGEWQYQQGFGGMRKGQAFRLREGATSWGHPYLALGFSLEPHPKNPQQKVLTVLYRNGESLGRVFDRLK